MCVVNDARSFGHSDRVVAEVEGVYQLFKFQSVGSRCWLLPTNGGQGCFVTVQQFKGVVVSQARCWAV